MLFGSNTSFIGGESNLRVIENSLMSLGGQTENVSNKENPPPIRDFMNERSLKLTKILNLNLLNLIVKIYHSGASLASSKFNLKTTSKTMQ